MSTLAGDTASAYAHAAPPTPLARRPTPLSSAVLHYVGTAAANGSGLTPSRLAAGLRGTYALARSGGGVRSRWSLTSTLRAIMAKRPWPSTTSPSTSP